MMDVAAIRVEALDYARNEGVLNKAKHHLVAVAKSVECKLDGIESIGQTCGRVFRAGARNHAAVHAADPALRRGFRLG